MYSSVILSSKFNAGIQNGSQTANLFVFLIQIFLPGILAPSNAAINMKVATAGPSAGTYTRASKWRMQ